MTNSKCVILFRIRNISESVEIDFPPCKVEEDDPIGLLANRLGAADVSNSSQLTDATIDSFFNQHKTSIVTFYQKCGCIILMNLIAW